jgi:hypothetical protein
MKNTRIVKIKTWDEMEKNYENSFNIGMENRMPKNRIITLKCYDDDEVWFWKNYIMDNDMIEEELNPEDYSQ